MGLLTCPSCNKINKASRDECWSCSSTIHSPKRRNPDNNEWANGTFAYRRRNPIIDPSVGTDMAKQLFFTNPKGESTMRSMKRYNRNPQRWGNYLKRRNPDNFGESLFTSLYAKRRAHRNPQSATWSDPSFNASAAPQQGVWGKTLFRRKRNPQAATWSDPSFNASGGPQQGAWGKTLFRNPEGQAPVWGSPSFGNNMAAWGKTLFRGRRNPEGQAPVWGSPSFGNNMAVWGKNLFRRRRNPEGQAPVWGSPSFGNNMAAWGKTLFRNPSDFDLDLDNDVDLDLDSDRDDRSISEIVDDNWRDNPEGQAPVWGSPSFGNNMAAWGKTLFRRNNPDAEFDGMVSYDDNLENDVLDDDFDVDQALGRHKRFRRN